MKRNYQALMVEVIDITALDVITLSQNGYSFDGEEQTHGDIFGRGFEE